MDKLQQLLQQGITAYNAGKRDEARAMFIRVVSGIPDDEQAWSWMYEVCDTNQERIHCLKQLMRINPKNDKANQLLEQFMVSDIPPGQPKAQDTNLDQSTLNKQQQKNENLEQTDRRIAIRTSWEYCEVVLNTAGLQAQGLFFLGLGKGSASFGIYGTGKEEKIELNQIGQFIANLGQAGWELVIVTEALQPNTWLKTRWLFKRPKQNSIFDPIP